MFRVIEREVHQRRGSYVGSTALYRRLMRASEIEMLNIIERGLGESREGAQALLDRLEEARDRS
jgi:hypothetical protein